MRVRFYHSLCLLVVFLIIGGCRKKQEISSDQTEESILLVANGENLTLEEVVRQIPVGIDPADSLALFEEIINTWVAERVLGEMAQEKLPNLEEIDRKVASYRNRLLAREYLRQMREGHEVRVSQESVRRFYDLHKGELLTEKPLIKGIYLKISSSSEGLEEIRHLMEKGTEESVERLETHFGNELLQYDYFANVWVDWQTVADLIPYRFYDADAFLQSTRDFETSYNGTTYLLHIYDYLPSGSEQPFEFAKGKIEAILRQTSLSSYEDRLIKSLVEKAIKDGRLIRKGYDPVSRMSFDNQENEK